MENIRIIRKTLIGEIVSQHPEVPEVLFKIGMRCLRDPDPQGENLQDGCAVHGVDTEEVIKSINKKFL